MELQYSCQEVEKIKAKNSKLHLCWMNGVNMQDEYDILLASSNDPNTSILSLVLFGCQWRDYTLYHIEDVIIHASA